MRAPLIIGNGLIGSALSRALPQARLLAQPGFDLADEAHWPALDGQDVAFMCAAIPSLQLCEDEPERTAHINVTQTIKLLEKLVAEGTHVLFLSTNHVLGGKTPFAHRGETPAPQNEYGRQKLEVEKWAHRHPQTTVLRLTKVIGPDMSLFTRWQAAWEKGETVDAFSDMTMAPLWLDDVVEALIALGNEKRAGLEQYSGAQDVSYADIARLLAPEAKLVRDVSYRTQNIPAKFVPRFTSYSPTIGTARTAAEVISRWRAAQQSAR